MAKNLILWVIIAVVLIMVFQGYSQNSSKNEIDYTQFLKSVDNNEVLSVEVQPDMRSITGLKKSGETFRTVMPVIDRGLIDHLRNANVAQSGKTAEDSGILTQIFISWFPMILLIGIWIFFMRQMQGGGGKGAMSFGKSKAKLMSEDQIKTTFADVAGCDEAKDEVAELVDYLKDPCKFQNLGGKIPTGVLMVGPPGTGKTLLAKAISGEARVPFFTISGSDFVEMFVGVGASRVRDMFEQAKKSSPCIIFIDEIDAVGRQRSGSGSGVGGSHDEREQTLNQMLVEMDGFDGNEGVIVIAATNRPDVLDKALLRPGRFDRQVVVGLPDVRGREQILNVHMKKVPISKDVKSLVIARGTPGFSGADLANLVNEAALCAARANLRLVSMAEFEKAKDKILMGTERRSMAMTEKEKEMTAYHEAGHAIVGRLMPEHDPVYKVSIIPRGSALGVTMYLPERDKVSHSKMQLESKIATFMGGRIAEEIIYGVDAVTTGASNDIERATDIATNMVTKWGLSDNLGPLLYAEDNGDVYFGKSSGSSLSQETVGKIDKEIKNLMDRNYKKAFSILEENIDILHSMKDALMKYETIDSSQIDDLMARAEVKPPKDWGHDGDQDNNDSSSSSVSNEPSGSGKTDLDTNSKGNDDSIKDNLKGLC